MVYRLPSVLFFTGIFNVLLIKSADKQNSIGSDGKLRPFEHPFVQTIVFFLGEFLCFVLYKILFLYLSRRRDGSEDTNVFTTGEREFSPIVFFLPAVCDLIASYLLFTGLCLSNASSYQILKGVSLIFVGIFSVSYFDFVLKSHHWFGILALMLSSILICISDVNNVNLDINNFDSNGLLTGDLLIIIAQLFRALQLVYEEKYLKILNVPPLQIIGWEGIYGLIISLCLLIPLNFIKVGIPFENNPHGVIEDIYDAVIQLFNNPWLIISHLLFVFFTIFETYSCKSLIKDASCTAAIIIQILGIYFIWSISLGLIWEYFYYLHLIALITLLFGICLYKNILFSQAYRWLLVTLFRRNHRDGIEEVINQPADAVNI